jgi:hypothetical protein
MSSTSGVENCRQSSVENNKFNFKILPNFLGAFLLYDMYCEVTKYYVGYIKIKRRNTKYLCYDNVLSFINSKRFSYRVYHRFINKRNNADFSLGSHEKKSVFCDGKSLLCKSTAVCFYQNLYILYRFKTNEQQ